MQQPARLESISIAKDNRPLLEVVNAALQQLVALVVADYTGEVGSISLKIEASDRGDGHASIKPTLTFSPPKIHFASRGVMKAADGRILTQGDPAQESFTFQDLEAAAEEARARYREALRAQAEGEDPEPEPSSEAGPRPLHAIDGERA